MGATPGYNKERKAKLVKSGKVACAFCRYHRCENATHHHPKPDRYKNKRRS